MTVRLSTGLRNALVSGMGFGAAFNRGSINIYSGSQPATADSSVSGTLLGTVTAMSGALTQETKAMQNITVSGAAGSVDSVTVGGFNIIPDGPVPFRVDAVTTASDLCDAVNRNGIYTATVGGQVVTINPRPGVGSAHNGYVVATTVTTLTAASGGNMTGGVSAVNGLFFGPSSSGAINKPINQIWSFLGAAAGTAGWFRLISSAADAGGASSSLIRLDGSIASSGADMNLSNIAIAIGAPNTVDAFSWQQPAS